MRLQLLAVSAALVACVSSGAMAQYVCPPGYTYYAGVCQPTYPPGYSNPVSGAVQGEASGAAAGYAAGGPVGAVIGGALGTATGAVGGAANMLTPPPAAGCPYGYRYYNGACYR